MAHRDYEEFLESLNANGARYVVAGAHALAFHARPRATKDIDIYFDPAPANAARVLSAIRDFFGGADAGVELADLRAPERIVQLGVAPVRIDLLAALDGIPGFAEVWRRRVGGKYGRVDAPYISLDDLITTKRAAARLQDLADLRVLERVKKRRGARRRDS